MLSTLWPASCSEQHCDSTHISWLGLPTVALDYVLLFHAFHRMSERLNISVRRRKGFPSWSWAGWVGMLNWAAWGETSSTWIRCWLDTKTWISWYKFQHGRF